MPLVAGERNPAARSAGTEGTQQPAPGAGRAEPEQNRQTGGK